MTQFIQNLLQKEKDLTALIIDGKTYAYLTTGQWDEWTKEAMLLRLDTVKQIEYHKAQIEKLDILLHKIDEEGKNLYPLIRKEAS
jgi:hypothetical protein